MSDPGCLVCGHAETTLRFHRASPYLGGEPEYDFRSCNACGFLFAFGPTDADTLRRVYDEAFHGSSQQTAQIDESGRWTAEARRSPIVANAVRRAAWLHDRGLRGRLLDVGCGRGFSTKAQAEHFDAEGIELSADAAAFAQRMGARVTAGDILAAAYAPASFDVITMWDALSSMTDPRALADTLAALLKPAGTLVLTAPDPGSFFARLTGRYWPMLVPPVNLGYYTERSLRVLFERAACTIVDARHEAKRVSLDFAARKLCRSAGLRGVAESLPALPAGWAVPLNLGDIITIVATKAA